jgi:hypothetical protein
VLIVASAVWATLAFGKEMIAEPEEQVVTPDRSATARIEQPSRPLAASSARAASIMRSWVRAARERAPVNIVES